MHSINFQPLSDCQKIWNSNQFIYRPELNMKLKIDKIKLMHIIQYSYRIHSQLSRFYLNNSPKCMLRNKNYYKNKATFKQFDLGKIFIFKILTLLVYPHTLSSASCLLHKLAQPGCIRNQNKHMCHLRKNKYKDVLTLALSES